MLFDLRVEPKLSNSAMSCWPQIWVQCSEVHNHSNAHKKWSEYREKTDRKNHKNFHPLEKCEHQSPNAFLIVFFGSHFIYKTVFSYFFASFLVITNKKHWLKRRDSTSILQYNELLLRTTIFYQQKYRWTQWKKNF